MAESFIFCEGLVKIYKIANLEVVAGNRIRCAYLGRRCAENHCAAAGGWWHNFHSRRHNYTIDRHLDPYIITGNLDIPAGHSHTTPAHAYTHPASSHSDRADRYFSCYLDAAARNCNVDTSTFNKYAYSRPGDIDCATQSDYTDTNQRDCADLG